MLNSIGYILELYLYPPSLGLAAVCTRHSGQTAVSASVALSDLPTQCYNHCKCQTVPFTPVSVLSPSYLPCSLWYDHLQISQYVVLSDVSLYWTSNPFLNDSFSTCNFNGRKRDLLTPPCCLHHYLEYFWEVECIGIYFNILMKFI